MNDSRAILLELQKLIDLPPNLIELTLCLRAGQRAEVECKFEAVAPSQARADLQAAAPHFDIARRHVTKRYRLEEIQS